MDTIYVETVAHQPKVFHIQPQPFKNQTVKSWLLGAQRGLMYQATLELLSKINHNPIMFGQEPIFKSLRVQLPDGLNGPACCEVPAALASSALRMGFGGV